MMKHIFFNRSRKLYIDILIIFVSVFLTAMISIISYLEYNQYQQSMILSKQILEQNGNLISKEIDNYLRPAQVSEILDDLLVKKTEKFQYSSFTLFMQSALRSYPYMSSIYLVDNDGNFAQEIHVSKNRHYSRKQIKERPEKTEYITYIQKSNKNKYEELWIYKDEAGKILEKKNFSYGDGYNPYKRPWYLGAIKTKNKYWIEVYNFFESQDLGLTVSYNLYHSSGKRLGVIGTDFDLEVLNNFLKNQKPSSHGISFIVTNNNQLITPFEKKLNGAIESAVQEFNTYKNNTFELIHENTKYLALFKEFSYGENKPWLIGMLSPIHDFTGKLEENKKIALLISTLILSIGIILTVLISKKISKPIIRLAEEMDHIKNLKLNHPMSLKTNVEEIRMMRDSLISLRGSLQSFSSYVPKEIVEQLITQNETAKPGFKKQTLTVLFADISGFSAIAERMTAELLTGLLTEYFENLSKIIKQNHGTIDKYTGDGLMAFWGAPKPDSDQAIHACQAALMCQQKIHELNAQWKIQGNPEFITRIGIDTGITLVGNLGSQDRMNYTAIGETVNLAAYLETLNKKYLTQSRIIVSESVYKSCHNIFSFSRLDTIKAKGGERPVTIYSLPLKQFSPLHEVSQAQVVPPA